MKDSLLLGQFWHLVPIPGLIWKRQVTGSVKKTDLGFMSEQHHAVRNFCVRGLVDVGKPLSPALIAQSLDMPVEQVISLLDDLERHMTFLYRNEQGAVTWAYPVTVDETPHRVTFNSGQKIYAA